MPPPTFRALFSLMPPLGPESPLTTAHQSEPVIYRMPSLASGPRVRLGRYAGVRAPAISAGRLSTVDARGFGDFGLSLAGTPAAGLRASPMI